MKLETTNKQDNSLVKEIETEPLVQFELEIEPASLPEAESEQNLKSEVDMVSNVVDSQENTKNEEKTEDEEKTEGEGKTEDEENTIIEPNNSLSLGNLEEITNLEVNDDTNDSNELKEIDLEVNDDEEPISLKKPNEVYYEIYKSARNKAKHMREVAIQAYLEAKEIKTRYQLSDVEDSDDDESNFDVNNDETFSNLAE